MYGTRATLLMILSILIANPPGVALAMASSNYAIPSDSMNGGGGDTSTSANYKIHDTLGQAVAGQAAGVIDKAEQGYRTGTASGQLSAGFVDGVGAAIVSPVAVFGAITAGTMSSSAKLASATSRLHVINDRGVATWSATLAATGGPAATWIGGGVMNYNRPGLGSALTVDPTPAAVVPMGIGCTAADIATGPLAVFNQGVVDSITLVTAGGGAMTGCSWNINDIDLMQTVPALQPAGAYSISMTITVA